MASTAHDLNRERQWVCARRMSERRHSLGLTQRDVVERLEILGLATSNRMLSAMEHGQGLDVGRLPELAIALDCTVTYLLGLTADPQRWVPDDIRVPISIGVTAPIPRPKPGVGPAQPQVACAICEHSEDSHGAAARAPEAAEPRRA